MDESIHIVTIFYHSKIPWANLALLSKKYLLLSKKNLLSKFTKLKANFNFDINRNLTNVFFFLFFFFNNLYKVKIASFQNIMLIQKYKRKTIIIRKLKKKVLSKRLRYLVMFLWNYNTKHLLWWASKFSCWVKIKSAMKTFFF